MKTHPLKENLSKFTLNNHFLTWGKSMLSEKNFTGLLKEFYRFIKNPNFSNSQRFKDFQALLYGEQKYYDLQKSFYEVLERSKNWHSYDYNEGYFYQSFPQGKIAGLRDTASRISEYELSKELQGKRVLNIGCNLGFLDCELSPIVKHIDAFDINPYLIEIATLAKEFLQVSNINFYTSSFEDYKHKSPYDTVLSFANHSTYDQNTKHTIQEYFEKTHDLLKADGTLLVESHAPDYEKSFQDVLDIVESLFSIDKKKMLNNGTFLDKGRVFIKAKKK